MIWFCERRTRYRFIGTSQFHERLQHRLNPWQPHEYGLKVFLIRQEILQVLASIAPPKPLQFSVAKAAQGDEYVREICQFREIHK